VRWTRRRVQTITTWVIVVAWVVCYAVTLANADRSPPLETAVRQLAVPPLLWVVAARAGVAPPVVGGRVPDVRDGSAGAVLAAAVAALPERRREWGRAMTAELAEVQGRSAGGGSRSAVFAVTVTALVGAMVVLAVARSRQARPRLPVPAPTVLVTGGVAPPSP
jgi:hypothetical protein